MLSAALPDGSVRLQTCDGHISMNNASLGMIFCACISARWDVLIWLYRSKVACTWKIDAVSGSAGWLCQVANLWWSYLDEYYEFRHDILCLYIGTMRCTNLAISIGCSMSMENRCCQRLCRIVLSSYKLVMIISRWILRVWWWYFVSVYRHGEMY